VTALIEERSPGGGSGARLADDGGSVWVYLKHAGAVRAGWVRNRPGDGTAPRMPGVDGGPPLIAPTLLWTPDEAGVFVVDDGEPLALCRASSAASVAASTTTPLADPWGEPEDAAWADARAFWATAEAESRRLRDAQEDSLRAVLGMPRDVWTTDGGSWPGRGIWVFDAGAQTLLLTSGVAARPQPGGGRFELALAVDAAALAGHEQAVGAWLSGLSDLPWKRGVTLGDGVALGGAPPIFPGCDSVLLTRRGPDVGTAEVDRWWAVPLSPAAREAGLAGGPDDALATMGWSPTA